MTHFVGIFRRKKDITLKPCPLIKYKKGSLLWENHAENLHQKLVPDPLFLTNNPKQPLNTRKSSKDKIF